MHTIVKSFMDTVEIDYGKILEAAKNRESLPEKEAEKIALWAHGESFLLRREHYPELKEAHDAIFGVLPDSKLSLETKISSSSSSLSSTEIDTISAASLPSESSIETIASSRSSADSAVEVTQDTRNRLAVNLISSLYTLPDFKKEYAKMPLSDESNKFLGRVAKIGPDQRSLESIAAKMAIDLLDETKSIEEVQSNVNTKMTALTTSLDKQLDRDLARQAFIVTINGQETYYEGNIFEDREKMKTLEGHLSKEQLTYIRMYADQGSGRSLGTSEFMETREGGVKALTSNNPGYIKINIEGDKVKFTSTTENRTLSPLEEDMFKKQTHTITADISHLKGSEPYLPGLGNSIVHPKLTITSQDRTFKSKIPESLSKPGNAFMHVAPKGVNPLASFAPEGIIIGRTQPDKFTEEPIMEWQRRGRGPEDIEGPGAPALQHMGRKIREAVTKVFKPSTRAAIKAQTTIKPEEHRGR